MGSAIDGRPLKSPADAPASADAARQRDETVDAAGAMAAVATPRPAGTDLAVLASRPDLAVQPRREYWADRSARVEAAAHLTSVREQLKIRQNGPAPGHPSSPWNAARPP